MKHDTLHRIVNSNEDQCKSWQSKPTPKSEIDGFDRVVIRRALSSLYGRNIPPTLSKIQSEIKDTITISKTHLAVVLVEMGYKYMKRKDNRLIFKDTQSTVNARSQYLRAIHNYRHAGYDIVYLDETWVNKNHCTDYMWLPIDDSHGHNIPSGKYMCASLSSMCYNPGLQIN